jgi:GNAT superfamily N-acetyltransferase
VADVSVRPARAEEDADAVARVQLRAWRNGYAEVLPPRLLADDVMPALSSQWSEAAGNPPSARHHLLVATAEGQVVGFAATAPTGDEDRDTGTDAELLDLLVDPSHTRCGHGSRLLAAAVDTMRADGFTRALAWLFAADDPHRSLLTSAGWAPDGATRDLLTGDDGRLAHQVRLHSDITA